MGIHPYVAARLARGYLRDASTQAFCRNAESGRVKVLVDANQALKPMERRFSLGEDLLAGSINATSGIM